MSSPAPTTCSRVVMHIRRFTRRFTQDQFVKDVCGFPLKEGDIFCEACSLALHLKNMLADEKLCPPVEPIIEGGCMFAHSVDGFLNYCERPPTSTAFGRRMLSQIRDGFRVDDGIPNKIRYFMACDDCIAEFVARSMCVATSPCPNTKFDNTDEHWARPVSAATGFCSSCTAEGYLHDLEEKYTAAEIAFQIDAPLRVAMEFRDMQGFNAIDRHIMFTGVTPFMPSAGYVFRLILESIQDFVAHAPTGLDDPSQPSLDPSFYSLTDAAVEYIQELKKQRSTEQSPLCPWKERAAILHTY